MESCGESREWRETWRETAVVRSDEGTPLAASELHGLFKLHSEGV